MRRASSSVVELLHHVLRGWTNMHRRVSPTCEMRLGRTEAPRPVLRSSAAYKRRCNPVTVAYRCSNRAATVQQPERIT
jgi:hypothetical protein